MTKKILTIILILIIIGLVYYFGFYQKTEEPEEESQLPNPAAVYCKDQGGTLKNVLFEAGEKGFCVFENGSECNQWDFFNRKCNIGDLKKEIIKEGGGKRIDNSETAIVHYVGTLEDETKFDSSLER
ncbi:DUF333 domain-containing protein, partial [Patescibacteria group bacterium]